MTPALLSSATGQAETRSFTSVVLCYGRPLRIAGQLMEVETCFAERLAAEMGVTVKDVVRFAPALEETITRAELRDQAGLSTTGWTKLLSSRQTLRWRSR